DAELVRERLGDLAQVRARPHLLDELGVGPTEVIRLLAALTLLQQVGQVLHWPLPVRSACRDVAHYRRRTPTCNPGDPRRTALSGSIPSSRAADRATTCRPEARTCRAARPICGLRCSTWRSSRSRGTSSRACAFEARARPWQTPSAGS